MKILMVGVLLTQFSMYLLLSIPRSLTKKRNTCTRNHELLDILQKPRSEYEQYRRRIMKNAVGFWETLSSQLHEIQKSVHISSPYLADQLTRLSHLGKEFQRVLQSDLELLQMNDGYAAWREIEAEELSELMQRRLINLQNPEHCSTARKALIKLPTTGLGSQLHYIVYSFIIAYATNRTMIVNSRNWVFNDDGWDSILTPFSDTCTSINGYYGNELSYPRWHIEDEKVVYLPFYPILPLGRFLPRTLPTDLAPRLERLHGNPYAWLVGQFLRYILRPRNHMEEIVEKIAERRGFDRPLVGVHIRRSDKISEVESMVPVEKYMDKVEDYFRTLELSQDVPIRRVYLATDDPAVISEIEMKYKNEYKIFSNIVAATSAWSFENRFNNVSLMEIILDIYFLSLSDYLVCTFSSNVCRVAYEIMQTFHPDASYKGYSMDVNYFCDFELFNNPVAVYPHRGQIPGEMRLEVGQEIDEIMELESGYSSGVNRHLKQAGWYPSFKVQEILKSYDFPHK